jgi:hypothetical protein
MFIISVNQTNSLDSYGGHQFIFQSHPSTDHPDAQTVSTSLLYTKLDRDEYLILSYDADLGLSVTQQNDEDFEHDNPSVGKGRSGLPLHERFANYVPPVEKFSLKV